MKKSLLWLLIMLLTVSMVATFSLAGCKEEEAAAPAEEEAAEEEAPATETSEESLTPIVVACWSSPEHDNLVKVAAEYQKLTGNEVIIEEIAREAYFDKLKTVLVSGTSDYDAIYVDANEVPAYIAAESLADLNQFMDDPNIVADFFSLEALEPGVDFLSMDGKIYGFPSEGDTAWMFYRKDILEDAGIDVPQTWDEFLAAAKVLNNPPEIYGAVFGCKPDEAVWDFMHYAFAFGSGIVDKNYNVIINNEQGVKALAFYSNMLNEYGVVPPDVVTYGYNEILTTLQEGKAALGIEWMAATQDLQNREKSPKVFKDSEPLLQYTLIPGIADENGAVIRGMGGSQWGWAIPIAAENKLAAYKFIEWLTSKEGATLWALNGGIPSNTLALSDPEVIAMVPQFELLAEAMPYRNIFPVTTVTPELITIYNETVNGCVAKNTDPKEDLDIAAEKMTKLLTDAGYIK